MKTGLRLLSLSIDLFGKVHDAIEENKCNALEQLHLKTREDCLNFKIYGDVVDEDVLRQAMN